MGANRRLHLDLDSVPLAELRRRLAAFRRADLSAVDQIQLDQRVARIIDQFPLFQETLTLNGVLRARRNLNGEIFERKEDIWYPPSDKTKINRLSDAGEVLFYCADSAFTALHEVNVDAGDVTTLVHCRTRASSATLQIAFLGASLSQSDGIDKRGFASRRQRLATSLGPGRFHKYELIDDWLTELISRDVPADKEHLYRATIGFAHVFFTSPASALHYPSVKTGFNGLNLAMSPDVADKHFVPHVAWMVRFGPWTEIEGRRMLQTIPLRRSDPIGDDGNIHWQPEGAGLEGFEQVVRPPAK